MVGTRCAVCAVHGVRCVQCVQCVQCAVCAVCAVVLISLDQRTCTTTPPQPCPPSAHAASSNVRMATPYVSQPPTPSSNSHTASTVVRLPRECGCVGTADPTPALPLPLPLSVLALALHLSLSARGGHSTAPASSSDGVRSGPAVTPVPLQQLHAILSSQPPNTTCNSSNSFGKSIGVDSAATTAASTVGVFLTLSGIANQPCVRASTCRGGR